MVAAGTKTALYMGFGAVTVVAGAVLVVFWPALFLTQLQRMMTLTNQSMSFNIWREIPIPMYLECFMFNITNVDEILANGNVTLNVQQMGPYVFRETHTKTNITWNDHNATVSFANQRFWYFEPDRSNGSLSDIIFSVNPIIVTVGYTLRHRSAALNMIVDLALRSVHPNMFLSANVSQWLFEGISDPLIDAAELLPNIPFVIPYDKFGWFYSRNGSMDFDGFFNMKTGADDFSSLGNIVQWNYSNRTDYRDQCGEVRGSTGDLWAPEMGQPHVEIFAPDICTYLTLPIDREVTVEGITGVQYAANESVFDNGYRYPEMACYCDEVRDSNCLPPGALNVSACRFGAPAFVSQPHFLHADPHYPSKVGGLHPDESMNFRLALEMYTGMPLAVAAQLQINLLVRHVRGLAIANALPDQDTLVPMFWFRQEMNTTPEYAAMARFALNLRYYIPYALYAITVLGIALLMVGVVILVKRLLKSPDTTPILSEGSSSQDISD